MIKEENKKLRGSGDMGGLGGKSGKDGNDINTTLIYDILISKNQN